MSNVLFPCCADFQAIAAADVDFPTPPFPPTKITFFVNSFILKPPFNSNVFLPLAISPSPCVNANHEIFQSCRDTTPMYNKMPDSVYQSFQNIVNVKINSLHHVAHGQSPVYVECLILLQKRRCVF